MPDIRRRLVLLPELAILTVLAVLTRGWRLFTPGGRIFDEVHYEEYVSRYFSGSYYVDVHPPLGKLLYALTAWVSGVRGDALLAGASTPSLRVLPAFVGALLVPTFWWLLRELGATRKVAAVGAAMVLFDHFTLVLSRFVLLDILLLWCGIAALGAFLKARRTTGAGRWAWLSAAALLAGAAVSIKWTGLATVGMIGALWLLDVARATPRRMVRIAGEGALLAALPSAVYVGAFAVHFALLPNDGAGTALMPPAFAATRVGNPSYHADARMGFAAELGSLHRAMMAANRRLETVPQPGASSWYTWPIAKHRLWIWQDAGPAPGTTRQIELLGNPVLWYGVIAAIVLCAGAAARGRVRLGRHHYALGVLAMGYAMNVAPFALISRPMYLYHYTFGLLFSVAFASFALAIMAGEDADDRAPWEFTSARARWIATGCAAALVVSFWFLAPLAYGTPLRDGELAARRALLERPGQ